MGQLLTDALVIKNETAQGANTATRVGTWMQNCAIQVEDSPSALNFFDYATALTTTLTQDVWSPINANITTGFNRNGLSVNASGLVTYSGDLKHFRVSAIVAVIGQSSRKIHVAIFKNDEVWRCSEFVSVIPSANEVTIPSQCVVPLSSGDTIRMYVKCSSHAVTLILDNLNVIINEF
jgi:hypothetical protein